MRRVSTPVRRSKSAITGPRTAVDRAMALAPSDPENYIAKAKILNAFGRAAEAEEAIRIAMRFHPRCAPGVLRVLAISQFHQEKYQDAVDTLRRVLTQQSDVSECPRQVSLPGINGPRRDWPGCRLCAMCGRL